MIFVELKKDVITNVSDQFIEKGIEIDVQNIDDTIDYFKEKNGSMMILYQSV